MKLEHTKEDTSYAFSRRLRILDMADAYKISNFHDKLQTKYFGNERFIRSRSNTGTKWVKSIVSHIKFRFSSNISILAFTAWKITIKTLKYFRFFAVKINIDYK